MICQVKRPAPVAHDEGAEVVCDGDTLGVLVAAMDDAVSFLLYDGSHPGVCPATLEVDGEEMLCVAWAVET